MVGFNSRNLLIHLFLLGTLSGSSLATPAKRTYSTHHYYSLELSPDLSTDAAQGIASSIGAELVEQIGELKGHWLVRAAKGDLVRRDGEDPVLTRWNSLQTSQTKRSLTSSNTLRSLTHLSTRARTKRVLSSSPKKRDDEPTPDSRELEFAQSTLQLLDPMFPEQWHLINTQRTDIELNVTGLWSRGVDGRGVKVAIIDDGLDMHSDDLADNFYAEGSYDFNDHTPLPEPRLSDDQHGTRCAGEIAAVPNDVCGVGVAYRSKIAGVRILSGPISDADEAAALNYKYQDNDIYSCSWGPPDDGQSMEAPEGLIIKAMVNGVQNGRDGKGSIFVFAAGNGGGLDDQCNFDGYTNSIFSITIGAMDRKGLHPYYSELCAAMLAVAPSSGSGDHIHTTDVGKNKCTSTHGGTSAAAPLAVGVIALALQVRPDLTWRDVQHLMVQNSVFFNPDDPDWEDTASGRKFSYKYGYGRIDAGLLVEAAERWELVKPQAWFDSPAVIMPYTPIPSLQRKRQEELGDGVMIDGEYENEEDIEEPTEDDSPVQLGSYITDGGLESTFEVTEAMLKEFNFEALEHVTVRVWIDHQRRGDVDVELISPNGITSVLARQRRFDNANSGYPGWKFMTLKHWGEDPVGTWKIKVKDAVNVEKVGRFKAWSLQLWGSAVDAAAAKPWTLPIDGQPDEEQTGSKQYSKPTDHLPGDHGTAEGEADKPGLTKPQETGSGEDIAEPTETGGVSAGVDDEGFFDNIMSLTTSSTWIFGAAGFILLAAATATGFFIIRTRGRRRKLFDQLNGGERGAYEPVGEDVQMGLLSRGRQKLMGGDEGVSGTSKVLYDAFAEGESEEEDYEEADEASALKYHDDFLEDEGEENGRAGATGEYDEEEGSRTPRPDHHDP